MTTMLFESSELMQPEGRQKIITALTTQSETSWAFPESYTANKGQIGHSTDGGRRENKRTPPTR